jgi:predicted PolB exonuclease-like 3'-5' exonuclease
MPAMGASVIVWDIETAPDLKGFAAANGHDGKSDDDVRAAMGDKFPKHIYHSIICIGALAAHQDNGCWVVDALGAPHVGERSEKALISSFVDRIAQLAPQLVTFNGSSFDLPVVRYRVATVLQSIHGRCRGPLRCPFLVQFPRQGDATRVVSGDGAAGQTRWDERCGG